MGEALRVTLIANAGLLLEYEGTTLLLDGIYGREGHPFSNLTAEVWRQMREGTGVFKKVDYLLFTHAHPDHCSPEMTLEYLRCRGAKGVFLPDTRTVAESGLKDWLRETRLPCVLLSEATDHAAYRIEPHITVRAFRTLHLDKKFEKVKHFCYLITFGDQDILITSDVDYTTETFPQLQGRRLRAVFMNPLFFGVLRRGRFFKGELDTETICVYHVPFAEDDDSGMRMRLLRDLEEWPAERAEAIALMNPFEQTKL